MKPTKKHVIVLITYFKKERKNIENKKKECYNTFEM